MATYRCATDDSKFAWVTNDSCFSTVDKFGVLCNLLPFAYLIYDFVFMYFVDVEVEGGGDLKKQMYAHHIIVLSGITCSLQMGYGVIWVLNLSFLAEVSNLFLNLRGMYTKEELN